MADILSFRQQGSTHGKGPLKLLLFWKLKLLEDSNSPSLSDIPTAVKSGPPLHYNFKPPTPSNYSQDHPQQLEMSAHTVPVRLGQLLRTLCGQYKILRGSSSRRELNLGLG